MSDTLIPSRQFQVSPECREPTRSPHKSACWLLRNKNLHKNCTVSNGSSQRWLQCTGLKPVTGCPPVGRLCGNADRGLHAALRSLFLSCKGHHVMSRTPRGPPDFFFFLVGFRFQHSSALVSPLLSLTFFIHCGNFSRTPFDLQWSTPLPVRS